MSLSNAVEPQISESDHKNNARAASRRHVLDLDDFSPGEIQGVLDSAKGMAEVLGRDIKKVPALRGRVIVTLFYEASTRTRISFEEAGKILSADVINMSTSGSSVEKGESLLNTGLTLQAMGVDTIVIRHPHSGAPNLLARSLDRVGIINAGDGMHAHPTQALLDLYTVRGKLGPLEGLKIVIVGDVLHNKAQVQEPSWCAGVDIDKDQSTKSREALLERAERDAAIVAAGHFAPADHIGKVVSRDGRRYWQAL